jgi:hypothetical protein
MRMTASRTIIEVLRRSDQGVTRPFLCRADNGQLYYVKGRDAGPRSLAREWVAGNLAREFQLPVPPFVIANIPKILVRESSRPDIDDLGSGLVFASAALETPREVTWTEAAACPDWLKERVLLFDWWVKNEDRCLNEECGNPNLLVTGGGEGLQTWVFDFNLAFDPTFCSVEFWKYHIFSEMVPAWSGEFRDNILPELRNGAARVAALFKMLPPEWAYLEGADGAVLALDEEEVRAALNRPFDDPQGFWNRA